MSNRNYEELIDKYVDKFKEMFPTFVAPSDIEEQMDIIEECLKTGTPYDPYADSDIDPDADY